MVGLDVDEYILQFEALLGETTWTHIEPGTLTLFQGGLPTWLLCRALNRDHRPHDLDSWQDAARQEVAREIELQINEARKRRKSPDMVKQSSSPEKGLAYSEEK